MSIRDRDIDDWFRRWGFPWWGSGSGRGIGAGSMFREFEEMRREMERMFEQTTRDIDKIPQRTGKRV